MTFSEERVRGPFSESKTEEIFDGAGWSGGDKWKNRSDRLVNLKGTIFEQIPGKWWIAYNEDDKPVASQGIGEFGGVYLLLGLHSKESGYGKSMANYVVERHGDKPILGGAVGGGAYIFPKIGFRKLSFEDGFLVGEEDLPTEVKSALEVANERGSMGIRKFFYLPQVSWWVLVKGV